MNQLSKRQVNRHSVVISLRLSATTERGLQGKIIRVLRISQGKTQSEVAIALGVSRSTFVQIEKRGVLDTSQLFKLARIFQVNVEIFDIEKAAQGDS
jgi:DNA-binding XRE family transcriptional regulator